jgi:peptidoglycan/xylan/chitin deacetylase (PgdA/CDA1 family)
MDRNRRDVAAIQVDLDADWVACASLGFPYGNGPDGYYPALDRFLRLFDAHGVQATFFAVGSDLEHPDRAEAVCAARAAGHEIASHGMHHILGMQLLSKARKLEEIACAEQQIAAVVGRAPVGFRCPACDVDEEMLAILVERGYLYDASLLPSIFARAMSLSVRVFAASGFRPRHKFGKWRYALAPPKPYRPNPAAIWREGQGRIVEFPMTVSPLLRYPFYGTPVVALGRRGFELLFRMVRRRRGPVNFTFHLCDLVDPACDPIGPDLARLPNVNIPLAQKERWAHGIVEALKTRYEFHTTEDICRNWLDANPARPVI